MARKPQPATRIRTCRACGNKFEYPIAGTISTRHHCEQCVVLPVNIRQIFERYQLRVDSLERKIAKLEAKPEPQRATSEVQLADGAV